MRRASEKQIQYLNDLCVQDMKSARKIGAVDALKSPSNLTTSEAGHYIRLLRRLKWWRNGKI